MATLLEMFNTNTPRAIVISIAMIIIIGTFSWVSIIDIKDKEISFWKLLITGGSLITMPIIASFYCGCPYLKFYLLGAIPIWFLLLFINIKFNNSKIIGKGDIDVVTASIADIIMYCIWLTQGSEVKAYNGQLLVVLEYIHRCVGYFVISSFVFIGILLIFLFVQFIRSLIIGKGLDKFINLRKRRISAIPMFMIFCISVAYNIMIS